MIEYAAPAIAESTRCHVKMLSCPANVKQLQNLKVKPKPKLYSKHCSELASKCGGKTGNTGKLARAAAAAIINLS